MGLPKFNKQPGETLDYDLDFSDWLSVGDFLVSAEVVGDTGININSTITLDEFVKVWVSGGTTGVSYTFTATVTTDDGRIKEQDFIIKVKER